MSSFPLASFPTINSIKVLWNSVTNSSNSSLAGPYTCCNDPYFHKPH